jgi:hypothetical protein
MPKKLQRLVQWWRVIMIKVNPLTLSYLFSLSVHGTSNHSQFQKLEAPESNRKVAVAVSTEV